MCQLLLNHFRQRFAIAIEYIHKNLGFHPVRIKDNVSFIIVLLVEYIHIVNHIPETFAIHNIYLGESLAIQNLLNYTESFNHTQLRIY